MVHKLRDTASAITIALLLALAIGGCTPNATSVPTAIPSPKPTATPTPVVLTPYASPTATPTATAPKSTPSPTPSPTPYIYTVKKGDTLLGIALKLGVTLKSLKEANPGINPTALSVGTKLIVPYNEENPAALPSPTPVPLELSRPVCAPSPDGSVVCLCEVKNPSAKSVGAVEVTFRWGNLTFTGSALLDVIPPHGTGAVVGRAKMTSFPQATPSARLTRALILPDSVIETTYPALKTTVTSVKIAPNKLGAVIKGQIQLPKKPEIAEVWVVATAYDSKGEIVGARRIEIHPKIGQTSPLAFKIGVYSVGVPITRTSIMAEAHAAPSGH